MIVIFHISANHFHISTNYYYYNELYGYYEVIFMDYFGSENSIDII